MVFGHRYRVSERLGGGGMADVYKAVDETLGRTVAVKVLHARYADDEEFVQRFRHEASAAANLSNPGIVNIYDYGVEGTNYYIVMELVRGTDLKTLLRQDGPMDARKVADYGAQVAAALSAAHGYGIIHRDIKPQNIVRTPDGTIKVMDFGIARAVDSDMTQTGSVLGTAQYVSPEQAQGKKLGPETDLYSLGVVLYELSTGRLPFTGDTPVAVALKHVHDQPVPPRQVNPTIPASLEAIIMKAMQKDPTQRYRSAESMREDLLRVASGGAPVAAAAAVGDTTVMPAVAGAAAAGPQVTRKGPAKRKTSPWVWFAVAGAVLLLLGMGIAWASGALGGGVQVPETRGMTTAAAEAALGQAGLKVGNTDTQRPDDEVPAGMVVGTDPAAGSFAERGQAVDIIISSGPDLVEVPDVVGSSETSAVTALQDAGFAVDPIITREYNKDYPKDTVFRTSPEGATEATRGAKVHLWVSLGTEMVKVPQVVGMTQSEAEAALKKAGFKSKVVKVADSDIAKGTVMDQNPGADGMAAKGSTVTITVSSGPQQVTVPDVVGLTQAQAIAKLESVGLVAQVQMIIDGDPTHEGKVQNQDPSAGSKVSLGKTVVISVAQLP